MTTISSLLMGNVTSQSSTPGGANTTTNVSFLSVLDARSREQLAQVDFTTNSVQDDLAALQDAKKLSQEDLNSMVRALIEKILDMQRELFDSATKDDSTSIGSSISETLGAALGDMKSMIDQYIDAITKWQVDSYIAEHGLNPDQTTYDAAIAEVRRAVSGERLADELGLPKGMVPGPQNYSVAEEVQIRKGHIEDALESTLGGLR